MECISQRGNRARKETEKERRNGKKTKRCRDPDAEVHARCVCCRKASKGKEKQALWLSKISRLALTFTGTHGTKDGSSMGYITPRIRDTLRIFTAASNEASNEIFNELDC